MSFPSTPQAPLSGKRVQSPGKIENRTNIHVSRLIAHATQRVNDNPLTMDRDPRSMSGVTFFLQQPTPLFTRISIPMCIRE